MKQVNVWPIFIRQKADSTKSEKPKWRCAPYIHFEMETIQSVLSLITPECYLASLALCEMCPNKEFFSGPYFPAFRLNTDRYEVSLRIQSEWGKIWTRKNSVFGHFSLSEETTLATPSPDKISNLQSELHELRTEVVAMKSFILE